MVKTVMPIILIYQFSDCNFKEVHCCAVIELELHAVSTNCISDSTSDTP
jgi:hypothetical protein